MMDLRFKKQLPDWYEEWIQLPIENKYETAREEYFGNHPKDTISDFHFVEIELWENRLKDPNKYPINLKDYRDWDIKFVVEVKKLLAYYKKLEKGESKKTPKNKPNTLLGIWTKEKSHYEKVIYFLKEISATTGSPFILDINGKLKWQKFDKHIKYLAAFTKACINKGHIEDKYSATDYQRIYLNSFNIRFNEKPFQAIAGKDFHGYSDVFAHMP